MPTRGRQEMARQAVEVFLSQTYEHKELWILDDSDCLSFNESPNDGRIHYARHAGGSIPAKRNLLTRMATGEFIMNIDSDDWSAPERMEYQLKELLESGKAVTGFSGMYFYDTRTSGVSVYGPRREDFVLGSSLFFRRDWALAHPFYERKLTGSDNEFVKQASRAKQLHKTTGLGMMVARHHPDCTNAGRRPQTYNKLDAANMPQRFMELVAH